MEREKESFKVWTDETRRIVYSKGHGVAHAHEIEWLYENIVDMASEWNDAGISAQTAPMIYSLTGTSITSPVETSSTL